MKQRGTLTIKTPLVLYTVLFLIIVVGGYSILAWNHLSMVWNTDALFQYYPTLIYTGEYLRNIVKGFLSGEPTVQFYDLSIAMGENIIGALNYYGLNDPINLLTVFVTSTESAAVFYALSYFIRIWMAGLCFQWYCRTMGLDARVSVVASLMYCFSGFTMKGCGRYIEWLPVLMYFPLMLIGSERSIRKRQISLILLLATAYGSLTGFYFLYMASLTMGIYWIVRLLSINGWKNLTESLAAICRLFSAYVLGLMLTAPVFLTTVSSYLRSRRAENSITDVLLDINNYIPTINDEIVQCSPFTQLSYSSYILIVEFIAVFLLFFFCNRKSRQLQIAVLIAFVASALPITGWIFNGFGETNIRWIFIVHFLMALVFAYVLSEVQTVEIRLKDDNAHLRWNRQGIRIVAAAIIVINVVINIYALYSDHGIGWQNEYVATEDLALYMDSPVNYSEVIANDDALYRVTHAALTDVNGRPENDAMLNGYYGIRWWLSMTNGGAQLLSDTLNDGPGHWRSWGYFNNPIYEAFSGIKYYLCSEDEAANEPEFLVDTLTFNNKTWDVYENPYYFGMAYTRDREQSAILWADKDSMQSYYEAVYRQFIDGKDPISVEYDKKADTVAMRVDTDEDELVVLVSYEPNWHAYVDGVEVEIANTDIAFMSIAIEPGVHEVVLHYVATEFYVGCAFMGLAILILIIRAIGITKDQRAIAGS